MPRTFSRGTKVTAEFLDRMQQYLSTDDGDVWVRRMRFLYCPEEGLIEQDLEPLLEFFLPQQFTRLETLIDSLEGGGIIPGSMKIVLSETTKEVNEKLGLIRRQNIPIV